MNKAIKFFSAERIFLVDGLGAALTAIMLGVILPTFEPFFGMPAKVLYPLAGAATCLAVYSLRCQLLKPGHWQLFLRGIALLNLAYCCVSLVLMYLFRETLTAWGVTYFVSEKLVILQLVFLEFAISRHGMYLRGTISGHR